MAAHGVAASKADDGERTGDESAHTEPARCRHVVQSDLLSRSLDDHRRDKTQLLEVHLDRNGAQRHRLEARVIQWDRHRAA